MYVGGPDSSGGAPKKIAIVAAEAVKASGLSFHEGGIVALAQTKQWQEPI